MQTTTINLHDEAIEDGYLIPVVMSCPLKDAKFDLGGIVVSTGIYDLCEFATAPEGASLWEFCFEIIARHARGDWGECDHQDWAANDAAVVLGERVASVYHLPNHSEVFVITEADRQTTTILLTEEY